MKSKSFVFNHINIIVVSLKDGEGYKHPSLKQKLEIQPGFNAQVYYLDCKDTNTLAAAIVLFKGEMPEINTIVHECWHIFCYVFRQLESNEVSFDELRKEAYAYHFEALFNFVYESLLSFSEKACMDKV